MIRLNTSIVLHPDPLPLPPPPRNQEVQNSRTLDPPESQKFRTRKLRPTGPPEVAPELTPGKTFFRTSPPHGSGPGTDTRKKMLGDPPSQVSMTSGGKIWNYRYPPPLSTDK